jgi:hypothetical protein
MDPVTIGEVTGWDIVVYFLFPSLSRMTKSLRRVASWIHTMSRLWRKRWSHDTLFFFHVADKLMCICRSCNPAAKGPCIPRIHESPAPTQCQPLTVDCPSAAVKHTCQASIQWHSHMGVCLLSYLATAALLFGRIESYKHNRRLGRDSGGLGLGRWVRFGSGTLTWCCAA